MTTSGQAWCCSAFSAKPGAAQRSKGLPDRRVDAAKCGRGDPGARILLPTHAAPQSGAAGSIRHTRNLICSVGAAAMRATAGERPGLSRSLRRPLPLCKCPPFVAPPAAPAATRALLPALAAGRRPAAAAAIRALPLLAALGPGLRPAVRRPLTRVAAASSSADEPRAQQPGAGDNPILEVRRACWAAHRRSCCQPCPPPT